MDQYKEGQSVCLSVKTLYERTDSLTYGIIKTENNENGSIGYWDLYNEDGELACMDGETCIIEQVGNSLLTIKNNNVDCTVHFTLTIEEANEAIFILKTV